MIVGSWEIFHPALEKGDVKELLFSRFRAGAQTVSIIEVRHTELDQRIAQLKGLDRSFCVFSKHGTITVKRACRERRSRTDRNSHYAHA